VTTIERVDPAGPAYDEWYAVYRSGHERPFDQPYSYAEQRVNLTPDPYRDAVALLARDADGIAVAAACAELPLRDNRDFAYVEVVASPPRRREGHGSRLLDDLVERVRDRGRTRLLGEITWGVGEDGEPARRFARRHGFEADLLDAIRELPLPATVPELDLDPDYELRTWRGPCPADLVDEYASLRHQMMQEVPSGEAGLEGEFWDATRVRHDEDQWVQQDREAQVTVARHRASGRLAGHTQLVFPSDQEVFQWDTLVLPAHRGHGLGLALKVRTMQAASDLLEGRRRITTYNAASNAHMIRVNERLGFVQTAWCEEVLRRL
jgi:GNAT superfamily N-acetyltransferase